MEGREIIDKVGFFFFWHYTLKICSIRVVSFFKIRQKDDLPWDAIRQKGDRFC